MTPESPVTNGAGRAKSALRDRDQEAHPASTMLLTWSRFTGPRLGQPYSAAAVDDDQGTRPTSYSEAGTAAAVTLSPRRGAALLGRLIEATRRQLNGGAAQ